VLLACTLLLSAGGCAPFWDEVLSRERDIHGYFHPPDPLVVLKDSTDGERRARALSALNEPNQHGGKAEDQEVYVKILTTTATTDRDPLCRLAAIRTLGGYKDPRAAKALDDIFANTKLPFTQDFNNTIRQTALRSIEQVGSEESRQRLITIARQPSPAQDASSMDRQQIQDEKLIAIRALGKYHQTECLETLLSIMETEKDVALRDRAHQSLQTATGKTLPAEPQVWRTALAGQPTNVEQPNLIQRVSGWFK
jgi:HEAT repeat protein